MQHTPELAQIVVDNGAVTYLAAMIIHPDAALKRHVLQCLSQIAKHTVDLAEVVVEAEIFPKIFTVLKDQDKDGRGHSEPVSLENLDRIDADYLFLGTLGGYSVGNTEAGGSSDTDAAEAAIKQAEQVPGFTELTAYREHHVIPVDGSLWTSTGGPLLMDGLVDSVVAALS